MAHAGGYFPRLRRNLEGTGDPNSARPSPDVSFVIALADGAPDAGAGFAECAGSITAGDLDLGQPLRQRLGQTIRLLGVNHPSSEYACVDGYGYNDGHMEAADAAAIASWNANAVRIPINEDCWLGINGQPNSNQGAEPEH